MVLLRSNRFAAPYKAEPAQPLRISGPCALRVERPPEDSLLRKSPG